MINVRRATPPLLCVFQSVGYSFPLLSTVEQTVEQTVELAIDSLAGLVMYLTVLFSSCDFF